MARAEAAHASVRADSIKGLAQSIAKPAYRRLLTAEPALRRAVPALIIAFLLTICVGAGVQILDHRRQAVFDLIKQVDAGADIIAERLDRPGASDRRFQNEIDHVIPAWARAPGRSFLVSNAAGTVVAGVRNEVLIQADGPVLATVPLSDDIVGKRLIDVL